MALPEWKLQLPLLRSRVHNMPVTRSRQMKTSGSSKMSVSRRGIETNYEVESSIDSTLEAPRECKDVEVSAEHTTYQLVS